MGGDLGRIGTLDCCFYTREQMSPKLAQSLHLHVTEKEEKKDLFWFCWLFFLASAFAQVFS
jgi:hypothetical protein